MSTEAIEGNHTESEIKTFTNADLQRDKDGVLSVLFEQHHGGLVRMSTSIVHDPERAEEIVMDAWAGTLKRVDHLEPDANPLHYITRAVTLGSIGHKRQEGIIKTDVVDFTEVELSGQRPVAYGIPIFEENPAEHVLATMSAKGMLAGLTPRQREVVILRRIDDLPEKVVAGVLGVSQGCVKSHLGRAEHTLRKNLTPPRQYKRA